MPELPEVETIRRSLNRYVPQIAVTKVLIHKPKLIHGGKARAMQFFLKGKKFGIIERRGKLLIWPIANSSQYLLTHLKMTGQFIYKDKNKIIAGGHSEKNSDDALVVPNKYTHIEIYLKNGGIIYYNDMRQFGYFKLVNQKQLAKVVQKFGIEPLTKGFTINNFFQVLQTKKKSKIKQILLDQTKIAGLGNIYVDEILHAARVRPTRRVGRLNLVEKKTLYQKITAILKRAVKERGTTFSDYLDADGNKGNYIKYLRVYGRAGEPCLTCKVGKIKKIKLVGRGTHYCPNCQK